MMIVRHAQERGHAQHGWLDSRHTFSFANYYDPSHMGFRNLRVINEDRVEGGAGFGRHPHHDMEIISYVVEGGLEHRDSMGNGSVVRPGDLQRMTAGRGVAHSEFNASEDDELRFLQIWILPSERNLEPGYEQRNFPEAERDGALRLVADPEGRGGSVQLNADARIYAGLFSPGQRDVVPLGAERHAWVQVVRGSVRVEGKTLLAGDGAALGQVGKVSVEGLEGEERAEVLVFDLP